MATASSTERLQIHLPEPGPADDIPAGPGGDATLESFPDSGSMLDATDDRSSGSLGVVDRVAR